MFGVNPSVYVRIPFICPEAPGFSTLTLRMKYEDGFVAYLNGVEIARRNAPAAAQWNSTASAAHAGLLAAQFEDIDVSAFLDCLLGGANVLAIQGLNLNASAPAFLILPELVGSTVTELGDGYFSRPTPGAANDPGFLGFVEDVQFDHEHGFYDTNISVALTCPSPAGTTIRYTTDGTAPSATSGISLHFADCHRPDDRSEGRGLCSRLSTLQYRLPELPISGRHPRPNRRRLSHQLGRQPG